MLLNTPNTNPYPSIPWIFSSIISVPPSYLFLWITFYLLYGLKINICMLYPFSYKQFHGILILAMLMLRDFVHLFIYPSIHVSPCLTFHPSIHKLAYHNQENAAMFISEKKIDVLIYQIWFIPSIPPITNCLIIIGEMLLCLFQKKKLSWCADRSDMFI